MLCKIKMLLLLQECSTYVGEVRVCEIVIKRNIVKSKILFRNALNIFAVCASIISNVWR